MDSDQGGDGDGLVASHPRLERPLLDGLDGFLIQAQAEAAADLDIVGAAVRPDFDRELDRALMAEQASLLTVLGLLAGEAAAIAAAPSSIPGSRAWDGIYGIASPGCYSATASGQAGHSGTAGNPCGLRFEMADQVRKAVAVHVLRSTP